jgi:hypothetical protein
MNHSLIAIFNLSVAIPAAIGIARVRKIDSVFLPFIICLCLAAINETVSTIVFDNPNFFALNSNIWVLAEALCALWQFEKWNLFTGHKNIYRALLVIFIALWVMECDSISALQFIETRFRIAVSFTIVVMGILNNNRLIFSYQKPILSSAAFLIGSGWIIHFTFKILMDAFWVYGLEASVAFSAGLFTIMGWVNFIINIIFIIAVICIPGKKYYLKLS